MWLDKDGDECIGWEGGKEIHFLVGKKYVTVYIIAAQNESCVLCHLIYFNNSLHEFIVILLKITFENKP